MRYSNDLIRRQDRLLDINLAVNILKNGEYGVLSMQNDKGGGYGIPISYVWDGETAIYIHCAPEGHKLRCIENCNQVSFCIVGHTEVIPGKFTTKYESVILQCIAHVGLPTEERMIALELILDKYSPDDKIVGMKYAEKSFHRTGIIRLDIQEFSGKCKTI